MALRRPTAAPACRLLPLGPSSPFPRRTKALVVVAAAAVVAAAKVVTTGAATEGELARRRRRSTRHRPDRGDCRRQRRRHRAGSLAFRGSAAPPPEVAVATPRRTPRTPPPLGEAPRKNQRGSKWGAAAAADRVGPRPLAGAPPRAPCLASIAAAEGAEAAGRCQEGRAPPAAVAAASGRRFRWSRPRNRGSCRRGFRGPEGRSRVRPRWKGWRRASGWRRLERGDAPGSAKAPWPAPASAGAAMSRSPRMTSLLRARGRGALAGMTGGFPVQGASASFWSLGTAWRGYRRGPRPPPGPAAGEVSPADRSLMHAGSRRWTPTTEWTTRRWLTRSSSAGAAAPAAAA